jgi:hypothetical protein
MNSSTATGAPRAEPLSWIARSSSSEFPARKRARRAGGVARLEDHRKADVLDERAHFIGRVGARRLRARDARRAQRFFHRRLVSAEKCGARARARDRARFAHFRDGLDMSKVFV